MFAALFKAIQILWPFLKEVVIRNRSLKQAVIDHKAQTTLSVLVLVMFLTVIWNTDQSQLQTQDLGDMQHKFNILQVRYEELQLTNVGLEQRLAEAAEAQLGLLARFDAKEKQVVDLTAIVNRLKDLEFRPPSKGSRPLTSDTSAAREATLQQLRAYKEAQMKRQSTGGG